MFTGIQLVCSCVAVEAWLSMIHNNYCETKDLLIHEQHLIISQICIDWCESNDCSQFWNSFFLKGLNVFLAFKWKEISNLTWGKRMRKSSIHTSHFPANACILLTLFILSKIGDNIYPHSIIIGDSSLQLRYCSIRNCSDQYVSFVEQYFVPKKTR